MLSRQLPYLTPQKVNGLRLLPRRCTLAIMCFRPAIKYFEQFKVEMSEEELSKRNFLLLHPSHTIFCRKDNIDFIVLSEIYGGPQTVGLIEELAAYGVSKIIGLSLAGSLKPELKIGTHFHINGATAEPGTTPAYDPSPLVTSNTLSKYGLQSQVVWTTNALYREYPSDVAIAKERGCSAVNIDTSHFFAACKKLGILCTNLCTVSDVLEENSSWENSLTDTVTGQSELQADLAEKVVNNIMTEYVLTENLYQKHQDYLLGNVQKAFEEMNVCKSHNIEHIHRVLTHTVYALGFEEIPLKMAYLTRYAAILHDLDDDKLCKIQIEREKLKEQSEERDNRIAQLESGDFPQARKLMADLSFYSEEDINFVIEMISFVSFASNANEVSPKALKLPFMLIPRYADRLEAVGRIGVERCLQFSKTIGNPLFTSDTPVPSNDSEEAILDLATTERLETYQRTGKSASMIDHFYDKLFHIVKGIPSSNAYWIEAKKGMSEPMFEVIRAHRTGQLEQFLAEKYPPQ